MLLTDEQIAGKLALVVDDQAFAQQIASAYLKKMGLDVETASSGKEGLDKAKNLLPDIILLDAMMPHMDGFEVCRRIRAHYKLRDIPIIFVTADGQSSTVSKCFAAGGSEFLPKPIFSVHLARKVRTQLTLKHLHGRVKLLEKKTKTGKSK